MSKEMSEHAKCAKEIRNLLKDKFPETKFSVKSESYSMGSSVRVSWTDGATTEQVNKLIDKYQYGHFDGMVDIYEYSNTRKDIPQVKYVCTSRNMSDEIRDKIIEEHNKTWLMPKNMELPALMKCRTTKRICSEKPCRLLGKTSGFRRTD